MGLQRPDPCCCAVGPDFDFVADNEAPADECPCDNGAGTGDDERPVDPKAGSSGVVDRDRGGHGSKYVDESRNSVPGER